MIVQLSSRSRAHTHSPLDQRDPESQIMPGVRWGRADVLFTPAYWQHQAQFFDCHGSSSHRLAPSFKAECVACLLGGHGIPAEIGLAAFDAILAAGVVDRPSIHQDEVLRTLSAPLTLQSGKTVRYRFAMQKSICITKFLQEFNEPPSSNHVEIRNWLTRFRGIGLKTASWIVRNWFASDEVAILDIHIHRAGLLAGVFTPSLTIQRDYLTLERQFLDFAITTGVRASVLDALIWYQMKKAGNLVHRLLAR